MARGRLLGLVSKLSLSVASAGLIGLPALADTSFNTTFGGAGNSFTASIGATGSFNVSGSGSVSLSSPPILGTPIGLITSGINLPNQSVNVSLNPNPITVNTTPTGSAVIRMTDSFNAQTVNATPTNLAGQGPGPNGKADAGPNNGTAADAWMRGTVDSLSTTLVPSQAVSFTQATLNGSANFDILFIPVSIPLEVEINASAILQNLAFNSIAQANMGFGLKAPTFGDNNHPNGLNTLDLSSRYPLILQAGNFSANANANINAGLTATLLGIDVGLGNFNFSQSIGDINEPFAILGEAKFIELATANPAISKYFDDLRFTLAQNLSGVLGDITLPVTLSGSLPVVQQFDAPLSLGFLGTITFRGTINATLNYSINANVTISNLAYSLSSNPVINAVDIPEAGSLSLMALAGLGGLGVTIARRRRSA